jgi:cytochrome d ubiquinol oxidase subunit II
MVMFWVAILAISILLYVLLVGFDLGIGILFGLTTSEERRRAMMSAVAPVWDGNETWLVVAGVVLWGAFPVVYATLFSALYLPLLLLLARVILRGVAFEFRYKTERMRWIWDAGFAGGSLAAAFTQGLMLGALVEGLPITTDHYAAANSAGSVLLPYCAASACVLDTRCSARAGW